MDDFRPFLAGWLRSHQMPQSRLGEISGIPPSIINRWLHADRPTRPSTENLEKLAPALGVPYDELLRICGYRRNATVAPVDPQEQELLARAEQFKAGLRGVPRVFWAAVTEASLALAEAMPAPVTDAEAAPVTSRDDDGEEGPGGELNELQRCQHPRSLANEPVAPATVTHQGVDRWMTRVIRDTRVSGVATD